MEHSNSNAATPRVVGRPFKKGQSGNPGGRPKGSVSLPIALQKELPPEEFAVVLAREAKSGTPWACQIVAERYWPKTTRIEGDIETHTTDGPHLEPFTSSDEIEADVPADGEAVH